MVEYSFLGLQLGSNGFKLQQIVIDEDSKPVTKTSDILLWAVFSVGNATLYIPVSKLDMEHNIMLVPSQLIQAYHDRTRTLIRKTDKCTATYPYGAILQK